MIIRPSNRIDEITTYYFAIKLAEIVEMNRNGSEVINLGIGSPDLAPPQEVIETLKAEADKFGANKYQSYRGLNELREAFASHYERELDVALNPQNEILPLLGSKEGIMHIAMSFLNPGDEVLVPDPGYPAYAATAKIAGAVTRFYDLTEDNHWLPDLNDLEKTDLSKVKIMWINYPMMPTGARCPMHIFESLVSFAQRNKILLCHDNPYNLILNPEPASIFQVEGAKACCLELYSLSKGYNMAGWRVGALIGHKEFLDTVLKFKSNMDSGMYRPIQYAAAVALKLGVEWYEPLNNIYRKRREKVWQLFDMLDCTYDQDSAGLFVWAKVPDYIADVTAFADEILYEARVFITPGFIFGSNGERYLRASLCNTEEVLDQAIRQIDARILKPITSK